MKVLLTHAYFLGEDPKEQRLMRPYPPLGILYLAAYLEERGTPVEVFDSTFSSRAALEQRLLEARPDVVGIYTNLMTKLNVLALMRFIRAQPALAATRIVLGGPEVTHHADRFLEHGADTIVVGEGEETMHALVSAWAAGTGAPEALAGVAGLVFRDGAGQVVRTGPRALMRSLDELPMPKRDALDLRPYLDAWRARHGMNAVIMLGTPGEIEADIDATIGHPKHADPGPHSPMHYRLAVARVVNGGRSYQLAGGEGRAVASGREAPRAGAGWPRPACGSSQSCAA